MATLADISAVSKLIAQTVGSVLEKRAPFLRSVNSDFSSVATSVGKTIDVIFPQTMTARSVVTSPSGSNPGNLLTLTPTTLDLTEHFESSFGFKWTDLQNLPNADQIVANQTRESAKALLNEVELDIVQAFVSGAASQIFTHATGSGIPAFSSSLAPLAKVRQVLVLADVPDEGRALYLHPTVVTNVIQNPNLAKVNEAGSSETLRGGRIGDLYDFGVFESRFVPASISGSLVGNIAFQREALGVAIRPGNGGPNSSQITHGPSGLSLTLTVWPGEWQVKYALSAVWGTKLMRSTFASILYSLE